MGMPVSQHTAGEDVKVNSEFQANPGPHETQEENKEEKEKEEEEGWGWRERGKEMG